MKKKYKITKQGKKLFVSIILLFIIIISSIITIKTIKYHHTYEYKFLQLNYTLEEYNILRDNLNDNELNTLLNKKYNKYIPLFIKEKYFIFNNLDRYLTYQKEHKNELLNMTIALVNVNRDQDYYINLQETDISKKETMLVNKYYALPKEYEVENLVNASTTYAYDNQKLNKEAYEAFKELANDAKKEGYTIIILSSYRTYEYQDKLWNQRKNTSGIEKADAYAARAGSSEHETGYAIDVTDYYDKNDSFKDTESYQWMLKNSYKYGYILRYPEGAENITGYAYESWHYRYVGKELAAKIYQENITFDEYYAYYLNNN